MRNHLGVVVATGDSPPIMITDDHKSSKTRVPNRKRRRGEYELETEDSALATPASSRPGSCCGSTPDEYTSIETPFSSHYDTGLEYFSRSRTPSGNSYSSASVLHHFNSPLLTPSEDDVISTNAQLHNSSGSWKDAVKPYRNVQYPMLEISTMRQNHMATTNFPYPMVARNDKSDASSPPIRRRHIYTATSLTVHQLQQQIVSPQFQQVPVTSPVTSPQERSQMAVSLEQIVPSQGPTHGGIEVTIVGNGLHQGLTLMFGDRPATTICWSPSSMVCVLPPSENTGPVVVSFKEHPMSNNEVPLFSYYNSGNKELLELSLQAVGLNNSGHFKEAKNTAICLLQDSQNQNSISLQLHRDLDSQKGDSHISSGVEYEVIKMLSQIEDITALELTNIGGQNILHLSTHLDYYSLVSYILARHPGLVNTQDCNGLSALHFGCLSNATQVIQALLNSGANISLQSNFGTPMNLVSRCIQPYQCSVENSLFNPVFSCITETLHGTNSSAWRIPRQFSK